MSLSEKANNLITELINLLEALLTRDRKFKEAIEGAEKDLKEELKYEFDPLIFEKKINKIWEKRFGELK